MSERVTDQGKIGRSATASLLDEGIDQCRSIGLVARGREIWASPRKKKKHLGDLSIPVRPFDYIVKAGQRPTRRLKNRRPLQERKVHATVSDC